MFGQEKIKLITVTAISTALLSGLTIFTFHFTSKNSEKNEKQEKNIIASIPLEEWSGQRKANLDQKNKNQPSQPSQSLKAKVLGSSTEISSEENSSNVSLGIFEDSSSDTSLPNELNVATTSPKEITPKKKKETEKLEVNCSFDNSGSASRKEIIFNEINWAGSKDNSNAEWIELKNISGAELDISGYEIIDLKEQIRVKILNGVKLPKGALYLLKRGEDTLPSLSAPIYTGALSNTNEGVKLFNNNCDLEDEALAEPNWPAGNSKERLTMERKSDLSWQSSEKEGGTPAKTNSKGQPVESEEKNEESNTEQEEEEDEADTNQGIFQDNSNTSNNSNNSNASSTTTATTTSSTSSEQADTTSNTSNNSNDSVEPNKLLIQKVQITGGPGLTTNDFIEIHNPNDFEVSLNGYRLVKRTATGTSDSSIKVFDADAVISAGGTYTWANSNYEEASADTTTSATIAANNGIAIRFGSADTGEVIDSVAWGSAENEFVKGSPYPENPGANQILERTADTGNNANDFTLN